MSDKVVIELTSEEKSKLLTFLLMTTKYRKGELEAWQKLSKERDKNGEPTFKNAPSNANFWQEMITTIETIIKKVG